MAAERIPKPVPATERPDVRTLPMAPVDGYVLSRVDGQLGEKDIAAATGLAEELVRSTLDKLASMGLVTLADAPAPKEEKPAALTEMDEDVELEEGHKRAILELYARLPELDHYRLLGVERAADKKAIKRAYFELAGKYHPDKHFRKKLGTFKLKMETIFGRITQAHDVLTNRDQRLEYDAYLKDRASTRSIEDLLQEALAEVARAEQKAHREAAAAEAPPPAAAAPPPQTPKEPAKPALSIDAMLAEALAHPQAQAQAAEAPPQPSPHSAPPPNLGARRQVLAKRLLGNRPPPAAAAKVAAPVQKPAHATVEDAMLALRRRYEDRVSQAKRFQAAKYADSGAAAMAQNDPVAAANSYRVALSLLPEDAELKQRYDEAQRSADVILGETYERQAQYEEKNEAWSDAARSWGRVIKARPSDALAHDRAAHCIVKSDGNLHEAAQLALRAVGLEPANPKFKLTLANVYLAAGLTLNARSQLEAALQLAPHDDTIQTLLKRVTKST